MEVAQAHSMTAGLRASIIIHKKRFLTSMQKSSCKLPKSVTKNLDLKEMQHF